jgi:hypothetical protein
MVLRGFNNEKTKWEGFFQEVNIEGKRNILFYAPAWICPILIYVAHFFSLSKSGFYFLIGYFFITFVWASFPWFSRCAKYFVVVFLSQIVPFLMWSVLIFLEIIFSQIIKSIK